MYLTPHKNPFDQARTDFQAAQHKNFLSTAQDEKRIMRIIMTITF